MDKRIIQTGGSPRIEFNISANLSVKGWRQGEVVVKCASPDDLVLDADGDEITIQCRGNTSLRVPYGTSFHDSHVSGDVSIKSVEGTINISKIAGNLSLRSIGDANIGRISGNLSARNIDGNLIVESCLGNVSVHDIQGNMIIEEKVTGNLSVKEIDGNARAQVRGNVSVELDPPPESSYEFHAKGNLVCRLPGDASAKVNIPQASAISVKMPDVELPDEISAPFEFLLGEGDASLSLSASGRLSVASRPGDWDVTGIEVEVGEDFEVLTESLNEQITAQIEAQMEMMEEELEHQLDSLSISLEKTALSAEQAERIAEKAREASERANRRAQEKIRRSQEKMQRKLEAARRRAERKARAAERAARDRRRRPEPPARPSMPIKNVTEPVSEEERLMILQMLEQGSISLEEAEHLLAALEGKSSRE